MDTTILQAALEEIQHKCIGIFKHIYLLDYIPVIANDNSNLTTISVGRLLGLSTEYIPAEKGHYVPFPTRPTTDGPVQMTLYDMMQEPIAFSDWYRNNTEQ